MKLYTVLLLALTPSCTPVIVASFEKDGVKVSTDGENVSIGFKAPSGKAQK
jgi:hypothetical protein